VFQFILALGGATCTQQGALWWASHHRDHHKYSDTPDDIHSPRQMGFNFSHRGWFLARKYRDTDLKKIRDFAKYPELVWLNRYWMFMPVLLAAALWTIGGLPMFIWGYCVSTVLLWEGTFTINSLSHKFGKPRYNTGDDSKNNWLLAIITLGEGWHNNHHHYAYSTRQGFFWWEYDVTFYVLKLLSFVGLVWDIRGVPEAVKYSHLASASDAPAPEDDPAADASA
jgi:stearoyl-CoA desaturase (delta-9 desaturase)